MVYDANAHTLFGEVVTEHCGPEVFSLQLSTQVPPARRGDTIVETGWADPAAVRSVVGSVDLPADDPDLQQADAYIRGLFAESAAQPILVRERGPRARPGKRSRG